MTMQNEPLPKSFWKALNIILSEFGGCDLVPRLEHLREEDQPRDYRKYASQLERAFNLVAATCKRVLETEQHARSNIGGNNAL